MEPYLSHLATDIIKGLQMYEIYINESELILCSTETATYLLRFYNFDLIAEYNGKIKSLLNYIDLLEKNPNSKTVLIHYFNYGQLKRDFKSLYIDLPAAGGVVVTPEKKILFIFRRKHWDLPKGKWEEGETKKEAALREVMEETGISDIKLVKKLGSTRHTFKTGSNKRAIKKSHWFLMEANKQKLIPQHSEDIEKAKWMTKEKFFSKPRTVYRSIYEFLKKLEI